MAFGRFAGVALLAAIPVFAQTPEAFESKVRNLAHPRYAEREKAARELEQAGESALPALREAAQSTDDELRARAASVVEKIERTARSQRLLAAPKLAFKFEKMPLDDAIAEVAKKAQRQFIVDRTKIKDLKKPITLDTGELPYWDALNAFYQTAGLAEDISQVPVTKTESGGSGRRLNVVIRGPGSMQMPQAHVCKLVDSATPMPASPANAFRVRPLAANFAQNKFDDIKGEITFHVEVDTAPGISLREIVGIEVRKATASDGRFLAAAYPVPPFVGFASIDQMVMQQLILASEDFSGEMSGSTNRPHAITLKTGGLHPTAIAELHGVVVAKVITPVEPILVVNQFLRSSGRESTVDGMTVLIKDIKTTTDGRVVVQLRLTTCNDQAEDILNMPVQVKGRVQQFIRINRGNGIRADRGRASDFKVVDSAGRPIKGLSTRFHGTSFDLNSLSDDVELTFAKPAEGTERLSLVMMGKRIATVEMPFVLKNVPLP
ncbi:MAG TPA: hypothetical protein VHR66_09135 [Gemmataceae bacterium]|jgi:hypothetical protein|nr:hypothetical protein [Gemmataceae bacterium]